MIPQKIKNINVSQHWTRNNIVFVTCIINNYNSIIKRIVIGEYITTSQPFDLNFSDFTSKWILIFYAKGQYDYGIPSENCRFYIKMVSCNKSNRMLKMKINICIKSSSTVKEFEFIQNDNYKNWVGPLQMESIKE